MSLTVIRNADVVVCMDDPRQEIQAGAIADLLHRHLRTGPDFRQGTPVIRAVPDRLFAVGITSAELDALQEGIVAAKIVGDIRLA